MPWRCVNGLITGKFTHFVLKFSVLQFNAPALDHAIHSDDSVDLMEFMQLTSGPRGCFCFESDNPVSQLCTQDLVVRAN